MAADILATMLRALVLFVVMLLLTFAAKSADLPNAKLTPGVVRTDLAQKKMCTIKWGKDHRAVTAAMKRQVFLSYGYKKLNKDPRCPCEIDHLISRELLGADEIKNLWPESYSGKLNARMKDKLENCLHKLVCNDELSLEDAQTGIAKNWVDLYREYYGEGRACESGK